MERPFVLPFVEFKSTIDFHEERGGKMADFLRPACLSKGRNLVPETVRLTSERMTTCYFISRTLYGEIERGGELESMTDKRTF